MKEKFQPIKIIHIGLCLGVALAYFFVGDLMDLDIGQVTFDKSSLIYLLIPIAAFYLSKLLYKQLLSNIDRSLEPEAQLPAYQTASLIRWAVLEGAAFIILFMKKEFILFGILLILYMAFLRPTEDGMKRDIQLYGN